MSAYSRFSIGSQDVPMIKNIATQFITSPRINLHPKPPLRLDFSLNGSKGPVFGQARQSAALINIISAISVCRWLVAQVKDFIVRTSVR